MSAVVAGAQYALGGAPWWTWLPLTFCLGGAAVLGWTYTGRKADRLADPRPLPGEADPAVLLYATDQQAMLAAAREACQPGDGRAFADHLRKRCPKVPDAELARVVLVTLTVARHHSIRADSGPAAALAAILLDLGGAAVELTSIDRTEAPQ